MNPHRRTSAASNHRSRRRTVIGRAAWFDFQSLVSCPPCGLCGNQNEQPNRYEEGERHRPPIAKAKGELPKAHDVAGVYDFFCDWPKKIEHVSYSHHKKIADALKQGCEYCDVSVWNSLFKGEHNGRIADKRKDAGKEKSFVIAAAAC